MLVIKSGECQLLKAQREVRGSYYALQEYRRKSLERTMTTEELTEH